MHVRKLQKVVGSGLPITAIAILTGCATPSPESFTVADIDESGAAQCQFLGEISESKTIGLLWASQGVKIARAKARNSAARLRATHMLWYPVSSAALLHTASGKAYRCDNRNIAGS